MGNGTSLINGYLKGKNIELDGGFPANHLCRRETPSLFHVAQPLVV